jgi:hypothetical protein
MKFQEFDKIHALHKTTLLVTQKLHGTNASIWIRPTGEIDYSEEQAQFLTEDGQFLVLPGKRTSFITLENDNFGFARFVYENKEALYKALGQGVWFGEWCGPGINSGEGLTQKRLALFAVLSLEEKYHNMKSAGLWPDRVDLVPVLFTGLGSNIEQIAELVMNDLKEKGSSYVPGYMRPEGIVIQILGTNVKFKKVFEAEETQWKKPYKPKEERQKQGAPLPDTTHLLQPVRLEKLLSRDEVYIKNLPASLGLIVSAYVADLESEGQLSQDEDARNLEKKSLGKNLFGFIKSELKQKGLL